MVAAHAADVPTAPAFDSHRRTACASNAAKSDIAVADAVRTDGASSSHRSIDTTTEDQ